jgi:hypothetical protein
MSEFKFACPVCGQHITADSSASGGQLECPTCFQKIVVPQAPTADRKFIIAASQVAKPRPTPTEFQNAGLSGRHVPAKAIPVAAIALVLIAAAGIAAYLFRDKITKRAGIAAHQPTNAPAKQTNNLPPVVLNPIPTNFGWTLNLTNVVIPDGPASGSIHGSGFVCERSTLQGGTLSLRQGKTWPPDLGLTILLVARQGEELSGKTIEIPADRQPPVPRVILRWKDAQQEPLTHSVNEGGYAMKIVFGNAANGRMPGKLYISLPDEDKSFVAGTFDAEIRKPQPPRKKSGKSSPPKT